MGGMKFISLAELMKDTSAPPMYYLQETKDGREFWDDYVHFGCKVLATQKKSPFAATERH